MISALHRALATEANHPTVDWPASTVPTTASVGMFKFSFNLINILDFFFYATPRVQKKKMAASNKMEPECVLKMNF